MYSRFHSAELGIKVKLTLYCSCNPFVRYDFFFFFFGGEGGWGLGESCSRIHERLILIPITKKIIKCTKNIVTWYSQLLNNSGSHKLKYFQVHLCSMYNRYWFSSILINGTRTMSLGWKEMNPMVQIWQHDCKRICTEPVMAV